MEKLIKRLKDKIDHTSFGQIYQQFQFYYSDNKYLFWIVTSVLLLLGIWLSGMLHQMGMLSDREIQHISAGKGLLYGIAYGKAVGLILFVIMEWLVVKLIVSHYRTFTWDKERRIYVSDTGEKGTARAMTSEEKKKLFEIATVESLMGNPIGEERKKPGVVYALKDPLPYGLNRNSLYVGAPGCGKTRCLIVPMIFQIIKRGECAVVTDPKGELYAKTAYLAEKYGYVVKYLNLDPDLILCSDSMNYMSVVDGQETKADVFATTLVMNSQDVTKKGQDFWTEGAINLCKALILGVSTGAITKDRKPGTLKDFIDILTTNTPDSLASLFGSGDIPGKVYFDIYNNADKVVKGNTLTGLAIKLALLANSIVKKVVSVDDIDINLLGKEKCIYYIGMSDQNDALNYLVALFFSLMFEQTVHNADASQDKRLKIPVNCIMEEMFSIGNLPKFDQRISTMRSRGINCTLILQDITQLQNMYPATWQAVINCCSTVALLGTGMAPDTAEFFSDMSGDMTVVDMSHRADGNTADRNAAGRSSSDSHTGRKFYTPHEARTMQLDELLVGITSYPVEIMKKIDYERYPMAKEMVIVNGAHHVPAWYRNLSNRELDELHLTGDVIAKMYNWALEENKQRTAENSPEIIMPMPEEKRKTDSIEENVEEEIDADDFLQSDLGDDFGE